MKYFVQDEVVHKYPISRYCDVEYEDEDLYDRPPAGYEKCTDCFGSVGKSGGKSKHKARRGESQKDSWEESEDESWNEPW